MWKNRLKELLYILENSNVNEIDVTFFGVRYRVVKEPSLHDDSSFSKENKREDDSIKSTVSTESVDQNLDDINATDGIEVLSPMPGTFYRSPSPDDDFFVNEGDDVKKGDTLCIIEAMKIMNEIESEENGKIQKILVEDGNAVEFNQPLFIINPK